MNNVNATTPTPDKKKAVLWLIIYLLTAIFIISLIKSPGLVNKRAGVIPMTNFEAQKPFQYRILLPCIIKSIEYITPDFIEDAVNNIIPDTADSELKSETPNLHDDKTYKISDYVFRIALFFILNITALTLFLFTIRQFAIALSISSERFCNLIPIGMVVVLPIYFNFGNFMYDFSHLFLFTLGLLLLYKSQWKAYVIIYTLALLNKETAMLLPIVFAISNYAQISQRKFYSLLIIQAGIFIFIKAILYLIFLDNPGSVVEHHLVWNLNHLSQLASYFQFEPIGKGIFFPAYINIPLPRGLNLIMFAIIVLAVLYGWREKSMFLKKSSIIIIILFIMGLNMGHINELRSYYAALPVVYLLSISGIVKLIENLKR